MMSSYKLGDLVSYPCDSVPFRVVGLRQDTIEIEGDWSGGTAPAYLGVEKDWVNIKEVKKWT